MKKSLVVLMAALAVAGTASAASTKLSPFTDNLRIKFQGFSSDNLFNVAYVADNGININGPAFINPDADALVVINSVNKVAMGYPSISMQYTDLTGGKQNCLLTFVDGPWVPQLGYKAGAAPVCAGITVGNITQQTKGTYQLTITNNEP